MEDVKCKKLFAVFQDDNLILEGPKDLIIYLNDGISICIEQLGIRSITIISKEEVSFRCLYKIFTYIERLLMLFDGRFIKLKELFFYDAVGGTSEHLKSYTNNIMRSRLPYYNSADFCSYSLDKLVDYENNITNEMYSSWKKLLDELDIAHQMFLYSVSDSKMPVDAKCAFLIELAEPLVEVVKIQTQLYSSLTPGEKGTSLRMCIDALISKYGTEIFAKEIANNYDKFLQAIVNSRVRIMHIKRKQSGLYLNGSESILYSLKIALLYRVVIFELLGISNKMYKNNMKKLIDYLDGWNGILEKFLNRLQ